MTRDIAERLLFLVNNKDIMELLELYAKDREEFLKEQLVTIDSDQSRGAILELRRFKTLRDEVLSHSRK